MDLICGVLGNMAQQYKRLEVNAVRAVATAAVRDASNQQEFIARASAALGTDVEIISGQEEARLIHLGVQSRWPHPKERFLIIDIGGGSAEIILSENERMAQAFSKPLGALRLQELFLRTDPARTAELHRLDEYIEERIGSAVRRLGATHIDRVVGTSATASAVVCAVNRIPRARRDESPTASAPPPRRSARFYRDISTLDIAARQKIVGIGPRRAEIIVPGTAVLLHVLDAFRICRRCSIRPPECGTASSRIWPRAASTAGLASFPSTSGRGGGNGRALRRSAAPCPQSGPAGERTFSGVPERSQASRRITDGCSKPPRICTIPGTTSAIRATINIPIIWWRIPTCRASR